MSLYSVDNMLQEVYSGYIPKSFFNELKEINKKYKQSYGEEFIKILSGHEMINGKSITKKQCGKFYICCVDRLPKEEVEEMRKYNTELI